MMNAEKNDTKSMQISENRLKIITLIDVFPKDVLSDRRVTKELGLLKCIQCGRCSASCPAASIYEGFSPRDIMRKLNMGMLEDLIAGEAIWMCGQCYTCHSRCPRNNSPATVILILRELAIRKSRQSKKVKRIISTFGHNFMEKGVTMSPDMVTQDLLLGFGDKAVEHWRTLPKIREEIGYSDRTGRQDAISDKSLIEIRVILEKTGFLKLLDSTKKSD